MRRIKRWLRQRLMPAPVRMVMRPPEQGEWIWNGLKDKFVMCPYDSAYDHWVLVQRRRGRWDAFVDWVTRTRPPTEAQAPPPEIRANQDSWPP